MNIDVFIDSQIVDKDIRNKFRNYLNISLDTDFEIVDRIVRHYWEAPSGY